MDDRRTPPLPGQAEHGRLLLEFLTTADHGQARVAGRAVERPDTSAAHRVQELLVVRRVHGARASRPATPGCPPGRTPGRTRRPRRRSPRGSAACSCRPPGPAHRGLELLVGRPEPHRVDRVPARTPAEHRHAVDRQSEPAVGRGPPRPSGSRPRPRSSGWPADHHAHRVQGLGAVGVGPPPVDAVERDLPGPRATPLRRPRRRAAPSVPATSTVAATAVGSRSTAGPATSSVHRRPCRAAVVAARGARRHAPGVATTSTGRRGRRRDRPPRTDRGGDRRPIPAWRPSSVVRIHRRFWLDDAAWPSNGAGVDARPSTGVRAANRMHSSLSPRQLGDRHPVGGEHRLRPQQVDAVQPHVGQGGQAPELEDPAVRASGPAGPANRHRYHQSWPSSRSADGSTAPRRARSAPATVPGHRGVEPAQLRPRRGRRARSGSPGGRRDARPGRHRPGRSRQAPP